MKKLGFFFFFALLVLQACESTGGNNTKGIAEVDGEVDKIEVNWDDGQVIIVHSKDTKIRFYEKATTNLTTANSLSYRFADNDLEIYYGPNGQNNIGNIDKELYIFVPVTVKLEDLEVKTTSGAIQVDIDSKEADIETETGWVRYTNCLETFDAEISSVSGNVSLVLPSTSTFLLEFLTESGIFVNEEFTLTQDDGKWVCGDAKSDIIVQTRSGNLALIKKTD